MIPGPEQGPRFVSGFFDDNQLVLTREDETIARSAIFMFEGALVDNGDGTASIVGLEEE